MLSSVQNTGARSQARRRSPVCRLQEKPASRCNAAQGVAASVTLPDRNNFPGWPRIQNKVTSDWNQMCGWALKSLLWDGKEDRERKWLAPSPSLSQGDDLPVLFSLERAGIESDSASSTSTVSTLQLGKLQTGQMICPRFPLQDSSRTGNKIRTLGVYSCCFCFDHVCILQAKR